MKDSETYLVDQRPAVAVIAAFNSLSFSLINKLIKNSCRVVVISDQTDNWKREVGPTKRNQDLLIVKKETSGFHQKFDYVILVDLQQKEEQTSDRIETAKELARINSAKSLFVFPYVQGTSQQKALASKVGGILKDAGLVATVIYVGHLMGPNMDLYQDNPFANVLKDVATGAAVRVSKKPIYFYPVSVEQVSRQLVKNLFSFGSFGKRVAIVSQPVSLTAFLKLLKKTKGGLNFVYDNRDWELSVPTTDESVVLTTELERLIKQTLEAHPVPMIEQAFVAPKRIAVSRTKVGSQSRRLFQRLQAKITGFRSWIRHRPVRRLASLGLARRWAWAATLALTIIALTPAILLFLGSASIGLARKMFVQGNFAAAKGLLNFSATSGRLTDGYLLVFSKTRQAKAFAPVFYFSNVLVKASETGLTVVGLVEDLQQFLDKIVGDEIYDPEVIAEELSLELDSLNKELGFFQGEINASLGLPRKLIEKRLNRDVSEMRATLSKAAGVVEVLPEILGKDEPTSYLVILQDNTELRPSGGLIGTFSLINFSGGRLTDVVVSEVGLADARLKGHVEPPAPVKNYLGESTWFLRDANWDPDFPTTAEKVEWFLDKEIEVTVDGVIAFDLDFVKKVLEETGQLTLNELGGIKINSQNIHKIARENISHDQGSDTDFLTALTKALFAHILQLSPKKRVQAMGPILESLAERHLQVFLHNSQARKSLSALNWDGGVYGRKCSGNCFSDWLGIVEANVGGNKTNYFIERSAAFSVSLEEGLIKRRLLVFLKNTAPESQAGQDNYKVYIRLLTPQGSGFGPVEIISQDAKKQVTPQVYGVGKRKEAGVLVEVAPRQTVGVLFTWEGSSNLDFNEKGEYRLHWRKQAGTGSDPVRVEFLFPQRVTASGTPAFSLIKEGSLGYNTTLSRDFVSRIYW
jgi:hypothetical protein